MKNPKSLGSRVELPLFEAFWISFEQIRKRSTRSAIVIASIVLGVAFMTYLQMTNVILSAYMKREGTVIEAYQFWLVVVSLFVCGVGIVNSTLIATYERYREICTMKCLGALDQHIFKLFLIEASLFGLSGGVFGFILGSTIAMVSSCFQLGLDILWRTPLMEILQLFGLTTILSTTLSIISTTYPALKAARLNPVEAMRYDV